MCAAAASLLDVSSLLDSSLLDVYRLSADELLEPLAPRAAYGPTLSSPPRPRVGVVGRCPGERALGGAHRTQRHNLLLSALHRLALAVLVARDLAAWQVGKFLGLARRRRLRDR